MDGPSPACEDRYFTSDLASASGYSVQQIRDLERLAVIPPALRQPNGYRRFTRLHLIALRAYRNLALAVSPVVARTTMRETLGLPHDEAVARVVALHVELAHARDNTMAALQALEAIVDESVHDAPALPEDSMTITELSRALGVRSSTLRFWEQQGLITPERVGSARARSYPPDAVRGARIVAMLRAGGYRLPAVQTIVTSLRGTDGPAETRDALEGRLRTIASQSEALLRAGADIVELLAKSSVGEVPGDAN